MHKTRSAFQMRAVFRVASHDVDAFVAKASGLHAGLFSSPRASSGYLGAIGSNQSTFSAADALETKWRT